MTYTDAITGLEVESSVVYFVINQNGYVCAEFNTRAEAQRWIMKKGVVGYTINPLEI